MPTPADKLAAILRQALDGFANDNPDLFKTSVNVSGGGGGGTGGGSAGDLIGTILAIAGVASILDPEAFAIKKALDSVQSAGGQEGTWFGSGWFVGETLLKYADPYSRILQHALEASVVSQIFDPATAASLSARGILTHEQAVSEAAGGGLDGQHVSWLTEREHSYLDVITVLRLWNLGHIDEQTVDLSLQRIGITPSLTTQVKELRRQYLSIADVALGNLRGDITDADAQAYAAQLGMTKDDFARFVYNTGEPPGLMQLLEAYRRSYIDEPRLRQGVRQSRVRDEWFDVILALRYERMSAADAISATVQNHLDRDQGLAAAELAGLHPDDFPVLLETAGEPLSRTEMTELVNRGEATVAEYAQAMRESRLKDKYIPFAEKLLRRLIPYRTINTILAHGVRDQKWGIKYLMDLGYTEDDATALVSTSTSSKTSHIKQLTEAQILTLFEARAIKEEEAIRDLGNIGYAPDEAKFILEYAAARRALTEENRTLGFLRTAYMNHRVTIIEASNAMDKLGVPADQRDKLKAEWELERASQVKVLSAAEICDAVKYGMVRFADAQARLIEMGYSDNEAKIRLGVALHGLPKGVTVDPVS